MEAEINDLRAALVSEVKSAEKESERRAKEDEDIRRQLEVRYSALIPQSTFPSTLLTKLCYNPNKTCWYMMLLSLFLY